MEPTVVTEGLINYVVTRMAFNVRKYVLKNEVSIILYGEGQKEVQVVGASVGTMIKVGTGIATKLIAIKTYENLCKKARLVLKERATCGNVQARQESIGFYENLLADDNIQPRTKLRARQNLDKIMGVADHTGQGFGVAPMSGNNNTQVINVDTLGLTLEQKKKLLEESRGSSSPRQS